MSIKANSIIAIEGNIGVGKSTLGQSLERYLEKQSDHPTKFHTEPFNQRMLEQFLGDQVKYAYPFQLYMLTRRQLNYALAKKEDCISIIDRSLAGDYVFAVIQKNGGNITHEDFEVYQEVYEDYGPYIPDHILFLDVSPEIAMERIQSRSRNGETAYTLEYLQNLKKTYKDVIKEHYPPESGVTIHWVDWSEDQEVDEEGFLSDEVCKKIVDLIRNKEPEHSDV